MPYDEVQHRADRGRGLGLERGAGARARGRGHQGRAGRPLDRRSRRSRQGDRRRRPSPAMPSKRADVEKLFADLDGGFGAPEIVIYNPSYRTRGPIAELDPAEVEKSLMVSAFGGFLVGQQAVKRMLPKKHGCIVFTGASASVKGYAQSAPFAMGKFALRGLAQSMARELHPQGIHVGACRDRRRHQERAAARAGRQDRKPARSRNRSPRPICISSTSRTAPGRGRWNCGPGWNNSDAEFQEPPVRRDVFSSQQRTGGDNCEENLDCDDGRCDVRVAEHCQRA